MLLGTPNVSYTDGRTSIFGILGFAQTIISIYKNIEYLILKICR